MKSKTLMVLIMCLTLIGCFQSEEDCREKILKQIEELAITASKMGEEAKREGDLQKASRYFNENVKLHAVQLNFMSNMIINKNEGACDYYFDGNIVKRK